MQMQALVPVDNLMEKLEDDLRKQKEKAEKNAKNLVQSAVRKKQSKDTREDKKNMKNQKNQADTSDEREKLQQQVNAAEIELARMEERQQQEQEVQKRIQKTLDQCKLPDSIPLTVMTTTQGNQSSGARAKVMEETMRLAKARLASMDEAASVASASGAPASAAEVPSAAPTSEDLKLQKLGSQGHALGIQAAVSVLRRQGTLAAPKKGAKGKKDDKAITAGEMKKIGKHLLK